jgi:hypothetical protein
MKICLLRTPESQRVGRVSFAFEPLHQPLFVMCFFEIGSQKLFAWAGFEP